MNWIHKLNPEQITGKQIINEFKPGEKTFSAVEEIQENVITKITVNGEEQSVADNTVDLDIALSEISAYDKIYAENGPVNIRIEDGAITNWDQSFGYDTDGQVLVVSSGVLTLDFLRMV